MKKTLESTLLRTAVLGLVVLLAALAVSCRPDTTAAEAEPEEAPDTLVIAIGAQPEALDPIAMASAPAATVGEHVHESLVYLAEDGSLEPALATSWEASADGLSWVLQLRQGVQFHDGAPFNAEAVKANLDRFLDPDSGAPYRFLIDRVQEVEATGEHEVTLRLEEPFAPMVSHLSHSFIGMLSPRQIAELGTSDVTDMPIGTGPYRIARWDRGERIVLERNEDYWGNVPQIPTVEFRFVPEDAARMVMLETGEAHAIMRVPPADANRLDADPNIDVVYATSVRTIYMGFNTQMEPFTDRRVRQAFNHAVNKEAIVNTILQGNAFPSDAPVVPAVFGHYAAGPYEYNPERARQLLAEAGHGDGLTVTLYHPTGRYLLDATIAEAVQGMLREVGVNLQLQTMEWGAYLDFLRRPPETAQHPMYMLGWGTVTLDADYGIFALLHSSQIPPVGWATSFYQNDRVDQLLSQARVNPDRGEREAMYREAIQLIWDDAPWLFLHNEGQVNAVRSNVRGLIHHPLENISAWDAYFE